MQRPFWSAIMSAINKLKAVAVESVGGPAVPEKRKKSLQYAMFLSYQGKNYYGMQVQKEHDTIEGRILKAMRLYGVIDESQEKNPFSFYFQRAARTDKSVSAVRQVCSMSLRADDNWLTSGPERLNELLPNDIRVIAIRRTVPSFHAQKKCDSRTYSYTMPTFAFAPVDKLTDTNYRITEERIEEVNSILQAYVGTHNFYNYTSRKEHEDQSCKRYIISFKCDKPFIYRDESLGKDVEFITLYIRGQSFMMHQIRKMIGMTIAVLRGFVHKTDIQKSFESQRMDVPKAPGIGLLLERLHYENYDKKFAITHSPLNDLGKELEDLVLKVRDELIISDILDTECKTQSMMSWLESLTCHSFATDPEAAAGDPPSDLCLAGHQLSKARKSAEVPEEECDEEDNVDLDLAALPNKKSAEEVKAELERDAESEEPPAKRSAL